MLSHGEMFMVSHDIEVEEALSMIGDECSKDEILDTLGVLDFSDAVKDSVLSHFGITEKDIHDYNNRQMAEMLRIEELETNTFQ